MMTRRQCLNPVSALSVLLASLVLAAGCPPSTDDDDDDSVSDDDDSAQGDDDTAGDDDDDTAGACDAPSGPYSIDFAGEYSGTFLFDDFSCTDYNGDEWSLSYINSSGWQLRVVAGPLVEGETLGPDSEPAKIDITLQNNAKQAVYSGRLSLGHVASVQVQRYQSPAGPCGFITSEALEAPGGGGGSITLSPQPIPFNCPN